MIYDNQCYIPVYKNTYIIVLREIVKQLNADYIYSKCVNATIVDRNLDINLFPQLIRNKSTIKELNSSCKININYITKNCFDGNNKFDKDTRFIFPQLKKILSNTSYNNNEDLLLFDNNVDYYLFNRIRKLKGINASIFNNKSDGVKKIINSCLKNNYLKKANYDNSIEETCVAQRAYLNINGDYIYSNVVYFDYFDFCNKDDSFKSIDDIVSNAILKINKNKIVHNAYVYHLDLYNQFILSFKERIYKSINDLKSNRIIS